MANLGAFPLTLRAWLLALPLSFRICRSWPLPEEFSHKGPWRSVGNHRYEIQIPADAEPKAAYIVDVRWQRADPHPEMKGTVLLDALSELPVSRCRRLAADAETGRFAFAGVPGGVYHLYYMPFQTCSFLGGTCPAGQTDKVEGMVQYHAFNNSCNDEAWWQQGSAGLAITSKYESRTSFDQYGPMERPASPEAAAALVKRAAGLLVVAEGRDRPVRMLDRLPAVWTERPFDSLALFEGVAQAGEAYSFQIAVAGDQALVIKSSELQGALVNEGGATIPAAALRCLNLQGVDYWGRQFSAPVELQPGSVAALWHILDVPSTAAPGRYTGQVMVNTTSGQRLVHLNVTLRTPTVSNRGFDNLWRGARLAWLDSTLGNEDDVPPPFVPVSVHDRKVELLDKVVQISPSGLLESITVGGVEALESPLRLEIVATGSVIEIPMTLNMGTPSNLTVEWTAQGAAAGVTVNLSASLDATGYADFKVEVESAVEHEVRLLVPNRKANAVYAAGLGKAGGFLHRWFDTAQDSQAQSTPVTWHWDGINHNNGVWVGSTRSGTRLYPKGDDPLWQASVPYDSLRAPETPQSWSNANAGGISVWPNGTVMAFTGPRGASRHTYLFSVLATPTRPLDLKKHFSERYAQIYGPVNFSHIKAGGATVVNVHQGNFLNPWINYPYLSNDVLKQAADTCHSLGMRLKVYNTMRELSNHALELWALRALNETFVWRVAEGGGGDWLREHLRANYSVAWAQPMAAQGFWSQKTDMAIRVNAMSRWNNYYVEGLRQVVKDYGCDGIYLDEIAYDRVTLRRAKAVLGKEGLIDHHSDRGGFSKVPAVTYMELYPFIDSLWYGEGFDYDGATADHWLVEISGIPFGLPSDMLRYGGNTPFHFRGMLFASTNRWQDGLQPGGSSPFDPRAVWGLWDEFGIAASTMYGWWLAEEGMKLPVQTNTSLVRCTTYVRPGQGALIALATFGGTQPIQLSYDWGLLGFKAEEGLRLRAPVLRPMQPQGRTWAPHDPISVPGPVRGSKSSREGWLLLLEQEPAEVLLT